MKYDKDIFSTCKKNNLKELHKIVSLTNLCRSFVIEIKVRFNPKPCRTLGSNHHN